LLDVACLNNSNCILFLNIIVALIVILYM